MSNWQPIKTAPKDGTEILVWRTDARCHVAVDAYEEGFWFDATHWMPLPDPPEEQG